MDVWRRGGTIGEEVLVDEDGRILARVKRNMWSGEWTAMQGYAPIGEFIDEASAKEACEKHLRHESHPMRG